MFGPEPRQIVRHRAPRRSLRPYPVVVAVLVTLASVPVLAAVMAGSASLTTTSNPRRPVVADPQAPVVVPDSGNAGISPTARSSVSTASTDQPSPTPTSTTGTEDSTSATGDAATAGTGASLRWEATRGGSGSRPGSAPRRSTPAPLPSNSRTGGGQPGCTVPTCGGSPVGPLPTAPPTSSPTIPAIPGILPSMPTAPLPASVAGAAAGVTGAVGGLLGVLVG